MKLSIRHNLEDYQLEEALEKAIRGLRQKDEREADFEDPFMANLFKQSARCVDAMVDQMCEKIEAILKFSP
jgi:hypothetical protein